MFALPVVNPAAIPQPAEGRSFAASVPVTLPFEIGTLNGELPLTRRQVHRHEHLFRAGQPFRSLYFVHTGFFKTSIVSSDGREKITGFRMRGELLGIDALGMPAYGCDAVALDTGEVWELPYSRFTAMGARLPELHDQLTSTMAGEIRRDWAWMLTLGTLNAEQRVVAFLLDLAQRQQALNYSPRHLMLRMTRAEIGNFLALTLETVTRVLSRLDAAGLIAVSKREIRLENMDALQAILGEPRTLH